MQLLPSINYTNKYFFFKYRRAILIIIKELKKNSVAENQRKIFFCILITLISKIFLIEMISTKTNFQLFGYKIYNANT